MPSGIAGLSHYAQLVRGTISFVLLAGWGGSGGGIVFASPLYSSETLFLQIINIFFCYVNFSKLWWSHAVRIGWWLGALAP
jgi:hypothetical protein